MRTNPTWKMSPLGALVESAVDGPFGSNLKSSHYVSEPGVRVVRLQNIGRGSFEDDDHAWVSEEHARFLRRHEVRGEDVLVASLGDENHPFGRACVYPSTLHPGIVKADCFRLRLSLSAAAPGFVARALNCEALRHPLRGLAQGVTRDRVNLGNLLRFEVSLPPLPEQRQIATILDTIDDAIRKTEQVIAKVQQVKQGLLHDLFTGGIDNNGESRDPQRHPERFKDSALGRIPREWEVAQFRQLCSSSAFGPRFSSEYYAEDGGVATLRTTDMDDDGNIELSAMPRADIALTSFASHLLEPHDLLISRSGTCGIAAVFPGFHLPVVPGAFLIRFRLLDPSLSSLYRRYFNSDIGKPKLARLAVGGVQKNIKGSEVLALGVPRVPPAEAQAICAVLKANEDATNTKKDEVSKLRLLKQGLMEDLLTGRVRVTKLLEANNR